MEKPALPSSWERITRTCLQREHPAQGQAADCPSTPIPCLLPTRCPPLPAYPRPVQGRDAVLCFETATRGDNIEAVGAVALDVQVGLGVPVLHHHNEPCPAVRQVVAGHPLAAL